MDHEDFDVYEKTFTTGLYRMCLDRKLSVALRATHANNIKNMDVESNNKSIDQEMHLLLLKEEKIINPIYNCNIYPKLLSDVLNAHTYPCLNNKKDPFLNDTLYVVTRVMKASVIPVLNQITDSFKGSRFKFEDMIDDLLSNPDIHLERLIRLFHLVDPMMDGVLEMTRLSRDKLQSPGSLAKRCYESHYLKWKVYVGNQVIWMNINNQTYVLPKNYMQLIHNKLCDLISVWLYVRISTKYVYTENDYNCFKGFIMCFKDLALEYKEKFFLIAKTLEGLIQGEHLIYADGVTNRKYLLDICYSLENELGWDYLTSSLRSNILEASVPFRNELGCLSKIMGHPILDIKAGVEKIVREAREPINIDMEAVADSAHMAKKLFIKKYIMKNGKWPELDETKNLHPRIVTAYKNGIQVDNKKLDYLGPVNLSEYSNVNIKPIQKMMIWDDYIGLIKDKTISKFKDQVLEDAEKGIKNTWDHYKETRLLLKYFLSADPQSQISEFIKNYKENITDPDYWDMVMDYNIIKIVPKEKELKELFRGFGAQTMPNRNCKLDQEKHVANVLEKYYPEQALTKTELEISKTLVHMRELQLAYKGYTPIKLSADAKSWCAHFLALAVKSPMEIIDQYYDEKIFGETQAYYENTLFYVGDGDTTYFWQGQKGGIEGLNQYTWMFVYIAQINTALEDLGYPYEVLCKGDDLRIAIMIPNSEIVKKDIQYFKDLCLQKLKVGLERVGHKIKLEDSYASYNFLSFSKSASIGNIELPQVFRKIQKVYGANNALIKDLDSYISSSYSNAHSSTRTGVDPISTFYVSLFWSALYMNREKLYRKCPESVKAGILMCPGMLGGFPSIPFQSFLVRTESDLLSPFIQNIMSCEILDPEMADVMKKFLELKIPEHRSCSIIVRDAYTIPIDGRPKTAESLLRNKLRYALRKSVQNKTLVELFSVDTSEDEMRLYELLDSCDIIHARVFSAMFSKSVFGYREELLKKFETGSSIIKLITQNKEYSRMSTRILRQVRKASTKLNEWRINLAMRGRVDCDISYDILRAKSSCKCPAEMAFLLRKILWGKEVYGVTMSPMVHFCSIKESPSVNLNSKVTTYEAKNHFTITYASNEPKYKMSKNWNYLEGPYTPFIGAVTGSGNIGAVKRMEERHPGAVKAASLLTLYSWIRTETNHLGELCLKLFEQYTEAKPGYINVYAATKNKGTLAHHQTGGGFDPRISMNTLSNNMSKFQGNSSTHGTLSTTAKYHVNFLQVYGHSSMCLILNKQINSKVNLKKEYWVITKDCGFCMRIVKDPDIHFNPGLLKSYKPKRLNDVAKFINLDALMVGIAETEELQPSMIDREVVDISYNQACKGYINHMLWTTFANISSVLETQRNYVINTAKIDILVNLSSTKRTDSISLTELKIMGMRPVLIGLYEYILDWAKSRYRGYSMSYILIETKSKSEPYPWISLLRQLKIGNLMHLFLKELYNITRIQLADMTDNLEILAHQIMTIMLHYDGKAFKEDGIEYVRLNSTPDLIALGIIKRKLLNYYDNLIREVHNLPHVQLPSKEYLRESINLRDSVINIIEDGNLHGDQSTLLEFLIFEYIEFLIENSDFKEGSLILLGQNYVINKVRIESHCNRFRKYLSNNLMSNLYEKDDGTHKYVTSRYYSVNVENLLSIELWDEAMEFLVIFFTSETTHVSFVYTDLPTTIRTIRTRVNEILEEDGEIEVEDLNTEKRSLDFYNTKKSNPYHHVFFQNSLASEREYVPERVINPIDQLDIIYHYSQSYRKIFGISTGTLTYPLEILQELGLRKLNYRRGKIASLADGYGGMTWIWSELYKYSDIIYVTKQDRDKTYRSCHPIIEYNIEKNANRLNTNLQKEGIDNITNITTIDNLLVLGPYDLISCDATYKDQNTREDLNVLRSLIILYREANPYCFLICRMTSTSLITGEGLDLLGELLGMSINVSVHKPRTSNNPVEVYITCQRADQESLPVKQYLNITSCSKFIERCLQWNNRFVREINRFPRTFDFSNITSCPPFLYPPPSFMSDLNRIGIHLTYEYEDLIRTSIIPAMKLRNDALIHDFELNPMSLTSKIKIVEELLFLEGLMQGYDGRIQGDECSFNIYEFKLKELSRRAMIRYDLENPLTRDETLYGLKVNYFKRFQRGILVGIRANRYDNFKRSRMNTQ